MLVDIHKITYSNIYLLHLHIYIKTRQHTDFHSNIIHLHLKSYIVNMTKFKTEHVKVDRALPNTQHASMNLILSLPLILTVFP